MEKLWAERRAPVPAEWASLLQSEEADEQTIAAYRKAVSPLLPASCRFHPSCSQYALEAVEKHGASRGSLLALGRLKRCHPWHPGGFDPVPCVGGVQEDIETG